MNATNIINDLNYNIPTNLTFSPLIKNSSWLDGLPVTSTGVMSNFMMHKESNNFTQEQFDWLFYISKLASLLSIISCFAVIFTFILWKRFRTPINRLIFFMSVGDLISSSSILAGRLASLGFTPMCILQGFLIQWGDLASVFWTAAMSFNLCLVLFMTRSTRDLESLEKYYFLFAFGIPFIIAFVPIFIYDSNNGMVYGEDVLWCWISPEWPYLRLFLFYIPIWTIFFINLSIYAFAGFKIIVRTWGYQNSAHDSRSQSTIIDSSIVSSSGNYRKFSSQNYLTDTVTAKKYPFKHCPSSERVSSGSILSQLSEYTIDSYSTRELDNTNYGNRTVALSTLSDSALLDKKHSTNLDHIDENEEKLSSSVNCIENPLPHYREALSELPEIREVKNIVHEVSLTESRNRVESQRAEIITDSMVSDISQNVPNDQIDATTDESEYSTANESNPESNFGSEDRVGSSPAQNGGLGARLKTLSIESKKRQLSISTSDLCVRSNSMCDSVKRNSHIRPLSQSMSVHGSSYLTRPSPAHSNIRPITMSSVSRASTNYAASSYPSPSRPSNSAILGFRRRYFIKIFLFLFAYILVWFFPTWNRITMWLVRSPSYKSPSVYVSSDGTYESMATKFSSLHDSHISSEWDYFTQEDTFWRVVAQELLTPLRGFINFLCYFLISFLAMFSEWKEEQLKNEKLRISRKGSEDLKGFDLSLGHNPISTVWGVKDESDKSDEEQCFV